MPRVLIVSNRLPVTVRPRKGRPAIVSSTGGVATGLGVFHAQRPGLWLGWTGSSEAVPDHHWAEVEADLSARGYQAVAMSTEEVNGFYAGFSNGVLWPLCHYLLDRIPPDTRHWEVYGNVNRRFADEVVRAHRPGDLVWVNDYHLMLVPAMVRARIPDARIAYFHHIPFPSFEVFRTLPWRAALLEGLLGADLIGVHTDSYAQHLRTAFRHALGADVSAGGVSARGRRVTIGAYPMGIDAARFARLAEQPAVREEADRIRHDAGGRAILLGVDRLDYTKGIPRRLLAFERLLQREPDLQDRVRLIQVAVPSRGEVPVYRRFREQVEALVGRINGQFGTERAVPIHYLHRAVSEERLVALYRAADALIVSPLRDGMNLVAKEFVAARADLDGVLILSEFTGASEVLREALIINPYDLDGFADTILRAIRLEPDERHARMRALRGRVLNNQVVSWATRFMADLEGASAGANAAGRSGEDDEAVLAHVADLSRRAASVHIFVDYDGTLVPFADVPELASPDPGLLALLGLLAAAPGLTVHLISGRSRAALEAWFGGAGLSLWAGHGLWHSPDGLAWEAAAAADVRSLDAILPLLERATAQTPGSSIEHKGESVAWHYRMADADAGPARALALKADLVRLLAAEGLEVMEGSKVLEVRPRGIHKGQAIERVRAGAGSGVLFLAIGDDTTDEDMFTVLRTSGIGISVGDRPSGAHYHLRNWQAVRQLLARIAASRALPPRPDPADGDSPAAELTP
jgi:trehalose 6-phosphate synthase/phosphatase